MSNADIKVPALGLSVVYLPVDEITPSEHNARTHSKGQIKKIARSIEAFGFVNPILIDRQKRIVAGHGRHAASKLLKLGTIPTIQIDNLSNAQIRAYIIADNQLAAQAGWDKSILQIELSHLANIGFDVELTGYDVADIDAMFQLADEKTRDPEDDDQIVEPQRDRPAVSRRGDLWVLGQKGEVGHRLMNGDAGEPADAALLMGEDQAAMMISDVPYNVKIRGHVSGKGKHRHGEFAMASGEMSEAEFIEFLVRFLRAHIPKLRPGSVVYLFIDWRHLFECLSAGRAAGLEYINLCVWNKNNGGMGSLYRSKHELVPVFRVPGAMHRNNVELGKHGRSRTNVWDYAGVNTFKSGRDAELAMHPTVKPALMIADAIRDVSKPGDIVLDPFGGSGTIFIAAEKTGRWARSVEIDPHYCDVAIRRWELFTGRQATLAATGETFEEVSIRRAAEALDDDVLQPGPTSVDKQKEPA